MLSKALELIKRNKVITFVVCVLILILLIVSFLDRSSQGASALTNKPETSRSNQVDKAAGDDEAESLNALTEEIHSVIGSEQAIKSDNEKLQKQRNKVLNNIRGEVQHTLNSELHKRGQDNQAKIKALQKDLQKLNDQIKTLKTKSKQTTGQFYSNQYPVDQVGGKSSQQGYSLLNGQKMLSMPVVRGSNKTSNSNGDQKAPEANGDSVLHPGSQEYPIKKKPKLIPYYTIPDGSTLADSLTMSALIGRVPVDGTVKSPYPFKMLIGGNNMAANGHHIPGISSAVVQGYTVGDMALSCVKGYITSITFIFPNGSVDTTKVGSSNISDLGFDNALGYISQPNGNPCFSGKFYSNAPTYLSTIIALGAINKGGAAFQQAQMTSQANAAGGVTSSLTGSVEKAMLGGAAQGGTEQAMNWFTAREKNSFDAVYVPSGRKAVINITKQIDINYNPEGRKINYEHIQANQNNTSLD